MPSYRGKDNAPKNRRIDKQGIIHAVRRWRRGSGSFVRLCDMAWVVDPVTEAEAPVVDCMSCLVAACRRG